MARSWQNLRGRISAVLQTAVCLSFVGVCMPGAPLFVRAVKLAPGLLPCGLLRTITDRGARGFGTNEQLESRGQKWSASSPL